MSKKTAGGQISEYTYDALGNLMSAKLPDGRTLGYLVDGKGRRVGKQVNGATTQGFLYEGDLRMAAELTGAGAVRSRFVYASRSTVPDYMVREGTTYRLVYDYLGSVRLVVNAATGEIAQRLDYDAFGQVTQDTNPGFQPFGFAGGLYDPDTKLVRFGMRDYDAEVGRWTARDPIGFAGGQPNLYVYVGNDPVNLYDPIGASDTTGVTVSASFYAGIGGGLTFTLLRRAAFLVKIVVLANLGFISLFQSYYYFSFTMPFFKIPDSFTNVT